MVSTQFAGLGRLRALSLSFLTKDKLDELARAKDTAEIAQQLESTWYGPEVEAAASVYKPPELIEVAVNRHLVGVNRTAMQTVPLFGKAALTAYLAKWDIENIELILAAKSLGKDTRGDRGVPDLFAQPPRRPLVHRDTAVRAPDPPPAARRRGRDQLPGEVRVRRHPPPAARRVPQVRRPGGLHRGPPEPLLLQAPLGAAVPAGRRGRPQGVRKVGHLQEEPAQLPKVARVEARQGDLLQAPDRRRPRPHRQPPGGVHLLRRGRRGQEVRALVRPQSRPSRPTSSRETSPSSRSPSTR